ELPLAPERAEGLLAGRGRAVAAPGRRLARVAARDRGAVERSVELVLVKREPLPQGAACPATPRATLLSLLHPGRLAEHVRGLAGVRERNRLRFQGEARLDAGPAHPVVALEGGERAVARAPACHGERTTRK